MSVIRSAVTGVGAYLPDNIVTNDQLAETVDTSDAWIVERTGIRQRHKVADDQPVSDLAFRAAQQALDTLYASRKLATPEARDTDRAEH